MNISSSPSSENPPYPLVSQRSALPKQLPQSGMRLTALQRSRNQKERGKDRQRTWKKK